MNSDKITVLYVDDEEHNLVSFKATFRTRYNVLTAISGSQGLQLLRNNRVDVIVSDQRMPEMTGVDFLIQSRSIAPDAVRIILTGYSDIESVVSSINNAQVYRYIGKPWEEQDLILTIDSGAENLRLVQENRALLEHLSQYNTALEAQVAERTEQLQKSSQELKRMNHEIITMNNNLITLHNEKTHFLSLAANEIKKPIDAISQTATMFSHHFTSTSPAQAQDHLSTIVQKAKQTQEIIANLLELNQPESSIPVKPEVFDLGVVLQRVDMNYRDNAKAKNITIEFKTESTSKLLRTDPQHLETILNQLVSNAIKYSPLHSTIVTTVTQQANILRCEVSDEGPGILDSEKHLVFLPYTKLSALPTGGESSTGLGLALVKKLVGALHGTVWFENLEKGVRFIVELPLLWMQPS